MKRKPRRDAPAAWLLAAVVAAGCGAATAPRMGPQERMALTRLRNRATDMRIQLRLAERRVKALKAGAVASEREAEGLAAELRSAGVKVTPRGASVVVAVADRVLFEPGEAELQPEAMKQLLAIARVLNERLPDRRISVEGHTDSVRPKKSAAIYASNWDLSAARSTAVVRLLVEKGKVAPGRISAAAFADTRPLRGNASPEGRAANRRVEIVLMPPIGTVRVSAQLDE